jgi:predicted RNA-binding Zn-ribbon protein involved in translation (DUF1610 family)
MIERRSNMSRIDSIGQNGNNGEHYNIFFCPVCGGEADNGHDREVPPNAYVCSKCTAKQEDSVNHPKHYTNHPSGIECIQITEHMGFNLGNALKYIWRCDLKQDAIEDLNKAIWYIQREILKRTPKV